MTVDASDDWVIPDEGLRALLDGTLEALVVMEADGRIVGWNRAAEAMFGWTAREAIGAELEELLLSVDLRAGFHATMSGFVAGGAPRLTGGRIELAATHRDGAVVPVDVGLSVVDCDDRPRFAAFIQDISERKAAQARSRRCETIVGSSGEAIFSEALDGKIDSWNPAAERLYGYTAQEMIGATAARLSGSEDPPDVRDQGSVRNDRPVSYRTRDGRRVEVAVTRSSLFDDTGAVTGVVSVVRDVSELTRTARRLTEADSRFAAAFAAASTGMALVALDGRFLAVNPALCELFARSSDALMATSFQALTHPEDLIESLRRLQQALAGEIDSFQQSKRYLLPDGRIIWALLTVTIARDSGRSAQHFVAQIQDITARKTAEGELRRYAAQLQALSEQDPLTGLLNQRTFELSLREELLVLAAGGNRCSVLLAAVDGDDTAVTAAAESLARASREADQVAHLGDGLLAILLPGVDARTATEIVERIRTAVGHRHVRCAHATAHSGEKARGLLSRIRRQLAKLPAPATSEQSAPDGIARLLDVARAQLGMPIAFLARTEREENIVVQLAGGHDRLGLAVGDVIAVAHSVCQPTSKAPTTGSPIGDAGADAAPRTADLIMRLGLRGYAAVPVRLPSGAIYGTLGCVDTRAHPELSERHAELLTFLSELVAERLEHDTEQPATRRIQAGATGVRTLLVALEARDFYTGAHSKQVVELASAVAWRLGLDQDTTRDVEQVALLHDIGKVGIPDAILQKQGPLDQQEWALMRQHPIVGEHIIAGTPGLSHLAAAMRAEHEHWDGGGYPDGLAGDEIPLPSRITLACDALNAMINDRPYRPAMTLQHAENELRAAAGTQFDPQTITALLAEIADSPADTTLAPTENT